MRSADHSLSLWSKATCALRQPRTVTRSIGRRGHREATSAQPPPWRSEAIYGTLCSRPQPYADVTRQHSISPHLPDSHVQRGLGLGEHGQRARRGEASEASSSDEDLHRLFSGCLRFRPARARKAS